jgi:ArsR family transcriptional regulator, virulence genes transcriptional regulator
MEYLAINAFANPVRIKLLCCLSKGNKNVAELMKNCGLAQSAVSQHLIKLKKANLVSDKRKGKFVYYSLIDRKTAEIANILISYCKEVKN